MKELADHVLLAYPCRQRLLGNHALDFIGPYGRPL